MAFKEKINNLNNNSDNTAWLVSFADLLSLILTFFVLVYSMSEIPQKKWQEYSSSIREYIIGNKVNIFVKEIRITAEQKAKKIILKKKSNRNYLLTLFSGIVIDNKKFFDLVDHEEKNGAIILKLNKDFIKQRSTGKSLTPEADKLFLNMSKIFLTLNNQIMVSYPSKNYNESIEFSDFIARKIEEYGYEYKVLRGAYFYNKDLNTEEIRDKFSIIIRANETIF